MMNRFTRTVSALAIAGSLVGGAALGTAQEAEAYQKYRINAWGSTQAACNQQLNHRIAIAVNMSLDRLHSKTRCYRQVGMATGRYAYYGYAWMISR